MQSSPQARRAARRFGALVVSAIVTFFASQAFASGPMLTGGMTSQPIGHYEFCKANPSECSIRIRAAQPERMTGALWSLIVGVNTKVNDAVKPMNDLDIYGRDEVWAYPVNGVGDCEDYVLEKRLELNERGVSLANLLVTVVRKPDGEGHAVLTIRTDKGDFVLDNLTDAVRDWSQTGYRFLKRQASNNTGRWVSIREGSAPLVGAVQ